MNFNFNNGVEFDPGFIQHLNAFIPNVEYAYGNLEKFRNFGQKKIQFKLLYPKIQSLLSEYLGFYLGCMLWAACIKTLGTKPVLNNLCYGGEYTEEESLEEIRYVMDFIEKFPKDVKYYLGQNFSLDSSSQNIIEAYEKFLQLNRGFVDVQTTDDIKLPETLKTPTATDCELILSKIEEVTQTGKLADLYSLYEKLF